jgi:hypothetical protein
VPDCLKIHGFTDNNQLCGPYQLYGPCQFTPKYVFASIYLLTLALLHFLSPTIYFDDALALRDALAAISVNLVQSNPKPKDGTVYSDRAPPYPLMRFIPTSDLAFRGLALKDIATLFEANECDCERDPAGTRWRLKPPQNTKGLSLFSTVMDLRKSQPAESSAAVKTNSDLLINDENLPLHVVVIAVKDADASINSPLESSFPNLGGLLRSKLGSDGPLDDLIVKLRGGYPTAFVTVKSKSFEPLGTGVWLALEPNQQLPPGFCIVFDNTPSGHHTLMPCADGVNDNDFTQQSNRDAQKYFSLYYQATALSSLTWKPVAFQIKASGPPSNPDGDYDEDLFQCACSLYEDRDDINDDADLATAEYLLDELEKCGYLSYVEYAQFLSPYDLGCWVRLSQCSQAARDLLKRRKQILSADKFVCFIFL